jgi:hypothetical protein
MAPLLLAIALSWTPPVPAENNALIQAAQRTGNMNQGLVPAGFFALWRQFSGWQITGKADGEWRVVSNE